MIFRNNLIWIFKVCKIFLGVTALDIAIGYDYIEIAEFIKEVGKLAFSIYFANIVLIDNYSIICYILQSSQNDFGLIKAWQDKECLKNH